MIGTVAFAASGAMVAIKKNLDLLGILVLGVITAVGGGMIRDLLIGVHPPAMFTNPIYVEVAFVSILLIFYLVKINASTLNILQVPVYEAILNLMDAIGLGVFTIIGVNAGIREGYADYHFLLISLGVKLLHILLVGHALLDGCDMAHVDGLLRLLGLFLLATCHRRQHRQQNHNPFHSSFLLS